MTIGRYLFSATIATAIASAISCAPAPSMAQSTPDSCIQQGHKPGTAGFYHCLQEGSSASSNESSLVDTKNGDAGSIPKGDPQDAVSDYAGSTMDGATKPDPDVLKNFNPGRGPAR